jgi:hypothetical protein
MSEQKYPISEFFVLGGFSDFVHRSGLRLSFDEMLRLGYSFQQLQSVPLGVFPQPVYRRRSPPPDHSSELPSTEDSSTALP